MEQLHSTQFVHHEVLYEDKRRALRGCDDRTYDHLARRRFDQEPGPRPAGRVRTLLRSVARILGGPRRAGRERSFDLPEAEPPDAAPAVGGDDLVVCIDLGNPLVGTSRPTSPMRRPDGVDAEPRKD